MSEKTNRNIKLIAKGADNQDWFDIYIELSGNREYLMPHRQNKRMYRLLKDGVSIDELERNTQRMVADISLSGKRYLKGGVNPRLKCRKNLSRKLENSIYHLISVANEYVLEETKTA